MKRMIFLGCLVLFSSTMLSAQERIEAPVWKMGEKWTFRYDIGGEWTVEIVGEEKDFYVDSSTRTEGRLIGKYKRFYDKKTLTTLATIMVTFYSEIAYPLVTAFYWAKHNPKGIFESTLDLCTL